MCTLSSVCKLNFYYFKSVITFATIFFFIFSFLKWCPLWYRTQSQGKQAKETFFSESVLMCMHLHIHYVWITATNQSLRSILSVLCDTILILISSSLNAHKYSHYLQSMLNVSNIERKLISPRYAMNSNGLPFVHRTPSRWMFLSMIVTNPFRTKTSYWLDTQDGYLSSKPHCVWIYFIFL